MNFKVFILIMALWISPFTVMADDAQLQRQIQLLQQQTQALQAQLNNMQKELVARSVTKKRIHSNSHGVDNKIVPAPKQHSMCKLGDRPATEHVTAIPASHKQLSKTHAGHIATRKKALKKQSKTKEGGLHSSLVSVKSINGHPESVEYNPVALIADGHVVTYIAGMPVVTSPYLGARPAFDGSDYIVNISSINRDIRLMQQRRRLYNSYEKMGYPKPNLPIVTLSGKAEPVGSWHRSPSGQSTGDWTLGSSELDAAAAINDKVEAYIALAYDESPPSVGGPRISNSGFSLNMGFVNIGDLDESPFYFTAGQLYVPFGRFSTAMISAPLTMRMARTKSRPFILGYKSQQDTGPFAAAYAYKSDTTLGNSAVGGWNMGYNFNTGFLSGELGASIISSLDDVGGLQNTGSPVGTTFGGFASITNGSEYVHKVPGTSIHAILNIDRYSLTAEWVSSLGRFHEEDLSFNGSGAQLQGAQIEWGMTFMAFDKPSSIGIGYQWAKDALALNLPEHRISGVFNISIWKDTVESLEYRHDINYGVTQFANGAAPLGLVNANTIGPGGASDTLLVQIGVYF